MAAVAEPVPVADQDPRLVEVEAEMGVPGLFTH